MQHFRSLENVQLAGSWVTIGSFDGVHLGHRAVIKRLVDGAHAAGQPAVVITFFPHPSKVLRGNGHPFYLSTTEERAHLLADLQVDLGITLTFNRDLAALTADEFMSLLSSHLNLRQLLVGHDFALGRGREGNFDVLEKLGQKYGYAIEGLSPFLMDGELVSSSRIRDLLGQGKVAQAARFLGRCYEVDGKVVAGDGRGRTIGIPTANLDTWEERLIPGRGVYATRAHFNQREYLSVTNIGLRPTFENQSPLLRLETHLLDFHQDLYGSELKLEFVDFLRPEQKFPSIQTLVDQINSDIKTAREVLSYDS
jgi:riboflavin kinase / FMN adenylyltransferase